jgi:hypothetical protein
MLDEKQVGIVKSIISEIEINFFLEDEKMELFQFFKQGLG